MTIITMTTMGMAMITMMIITMAMDTMTIMITITDHIMEESFMADLMQKTKVKGRGGHKLGLKSHKNTNFSIPEIMCKLFFEC